MSKNFNSKAYFFLLMQKLSKNQIKKIALPYWMLIYFGLNNGSFGEVELAQSLN
jgi:hypothetical protein